MAQNNRFVVPDLENPSTPEYLAWRAVNHAQASSIAGYLPLVNAAIAAAPGGPPAAIVYPNATMTTAANKLFADTYAALKAETLLNVAQMQPTNWPELIYLLDRQYNRNMAIDQNNALKEFHMVKFNEQGSQSLREWCNEKYGLLIRAGNNVPAAGRDAQMRCVLTSLLPSSFDEVCNRCRINPPNTWEDIRDALVDFDLANPRSKREANTKPVTALATRLEEVEKELRKQSEKTNEPGDVVPSLYSNTGGFEGYCRKCHKYGHKAANCWSKGKGKGKKGGVRKDPKKGKGKKDKKGDGKKKKHW